MTFHILYHLKSPEDVPPQISEEAIATAITFVGMCCQKMAFTAGRGYIREEIRIIKLSQCVLTSLSSIVYRHSTALYPYDRLLMPIRWK